MNFPFARTLVFFNSMLALLFLVCILLQPILIDSFHFDDTVFLANLGWRGVNGYFPNIDYPHFYGGIVAQFITWSFKVFGVDFKSIDYAFVAMYFAATLLLLALTYRRLSLVGLTTLIALTAALILSLVPIEAGFVIRPKSAHSMVYNHLAVAIMLGLTVFGAKSVPSASVEAPSSLLAGAALYVLVLLKTTFAVFAPILVVALLLQRRWISAALLLLGTIVSMLLMDPGMTRALGSLDTLLSTSAAESRSGIGAILTSSLENISAQLFALLLLLGLHIRLWTQDRSIAFRMFCASVLFTAGYLGALISMAGTGSYMLLPMLVVLFALHADAVVESKGSPLDQGTANAEIALVSALPVLLCYSFVLPAVASSAGTTIQSFRHQSASLISAGPAASYVLIGEPIERKADLAAAVRRTSAEIEAAIMSEGGRVTNAHEYIMYADGINLLADIPQIETYGIISNGRMFDFSPAVESEPVLSYPVWPTANLDYFQTNAPLDADIELVMMSRDVTQLDLVGPSLIRRMGDDFVVCKETPIWTLHVRRQLSLLEDLACKDG